MTKLHLFGIPHTRIWHTHCAFTGKVVKFPAMMKNHDYEIHYYGVDGDDIGQHVSHPIMTAEEQVELLGHDFSDHTKFHGDDANVGNKVYTEFNNRLADTVAHSINDGDIVLYPFGIAHASVTPHHKGISVESGIGYPDTFLPFRIFESYAWMHLHKGKYGRQGNHYEWVIPNYFVADDWTYNQNHTGYNLYFGRLNDLKGLNIVSEMAVQRPNERFVICGQGDPSPYIRSKNIEYLPPVTGVARNELLGNARCVIMPSLFTEPFGGVAVEAMMTGTPVITTTFGAFTETVEHGVTGYRCHTLGDFLKAFDIIDKLDRSYISTRAHGLYSLQAVAPQYDRVFKQLHDLADTGWYNQNSYWV